MRDNLMRSLYRFRGIQCVGLGLLLLLTAVSQPFCLCGQACCGESHRLQDKTSAPVETEGCVCCVREEQPDSSANKPCCASVSLETNHKTPLCPCFRQAASLKALLDAARKRPRLLLERYVQTSEVLDPLFLVSCQKLFTHHSDAGLALSPQLEIRNCSWRC